MSDTTQAIPILRVTPSSLVVYYLSTENFTRSKAQIENEENLTRGMFNGYMSPKTKSKVKKYLDVWFQSIDQLKRRKEGEKLDKKPYLTFVTLTLPAKQIHDDNEIKRKCLTPFIETLKRKYDVWNYFWRAEAQPSGRIHFHIIIDSFIQHDRLRTDWNRCINKLGYVDEFRKKHGHSNPNSTDIHKIQDKRSITAYVIKYCCKADGYREIKGRIHGCSDDIKSLQPYEFVLEVKDYEVIEKAIESNPFVVLNDPCFTYIGMQVQKFLKSAAPHLLKEMNENYYSIGLRLYSGKDTSQLSVQEASHPTSQKKVAPDNEMKETIESYQQLRIMEFYEI